MRYTRDDQIKIHFADYHYDKDVVKLLKHFAPPEHSTAFDIQAADAIFAFACGYQISHLPETEKELKSDNEVRKHRMPGANNEALAQKVYELKEKNNNLDLYLQFEVADVIKDNWPTLPICYTGQRKDMGTKEVLQEFMHYALHERKKRDAVIIIAHRHHYERCRVLIGKQADLEEIKIKVIQPPIADQYSGYDSKEAQPRAMSSEEFIVSDFISMAAMVEPSE